MIMLLKCFETEQDLFKLNRYHCAIYYVNFVIFYYFIKVKLEQCKISTNGNTICMSICEKDYCRYLLPTFQHQLGCLLKIQSKSTILATLWTLEQKLKAGFDCDSRLLS